MARPMGMTFEFPDLPGLAEQFRQLPKSLQSAAVGTAVKRAMKPAESALQASSPVGPTGNLRRGIGTKAKRYPRTGAAVAVVGFRKPGSNKPPKEGTKRRNKASDKTQHQFLVEYGTRPRATKSGAFRGSMPALHPIRAASAAARSQVEGLLTQELKAAYERALKQLPQYMAARGRKGRS